MDATIAARVDDATTRELDFLAKEESTDKSAVIRKILSKGVKQELIELALKKYSKREVSIGMAAKIAKIPLAEFMHLSSQRKIPINYSLKSLEEDFKSIK